MPPCWGKSSRGPCWSLSFCYYNKALRQSTLAQSMVSWPHCFEWLQELLASGLRCEGKRKGSRLGFHSLFQARPPQQAPLLKGSFTPPTVPGAGTDLLTHGSLKSTNQSTAGPTLPTWLQTASSVQPMERGDAHRRGWSLPC